MKLIYLLFLSFVILTCCSGQTKASKLSEIVNIKKVINSLKCKLTTTNPKEIKEIGDLSTECLLIILEQLDISDLVSISKTNSHYHDLTVDVFRRRYSNFSFEMSKGHSAPPKSFFDELYVYFRDLYSLENHNLIEFSQFENRLEIYDYNLILDIIQQFGSEIHRLKLDNRRLNFDRFRTINRFANKYCSNSAIELDLGFIQSDTLDRFRKPFTAVENLSFSVFIEKMDDSRPLTELFPNLRRLSALLATDVDYSFIDCVYPSLEHLHIKGLYASQITTGNAIENIFKKNPHIKSVDISIFIRDYVKIIKKWLPNVERLALSSLHLDWEDIQFDHVKMFKLNVPQADTVTRLILPALEELHINYSPEHSGRWLAFLAKHRNISSLHIYESTADHLELNDHFEGIAAALENLVEVNVSCQNYIHMHSVDQLIGKHMKLTKLDILPIRKDQVKEFQGNFGAIWQVDSFERLNEIGLTFRKK